MDKKIDQKNVLLIDREPFVIDYGREQIYHKDRPDDAVDFFRLKRDFSGRPVLEIALSPERNQAIIAEFGHVRATLTLPQLTTLSPMDNSQKELSNFNAIHYGTAKILDAVESKRILDNELVVVIVDGNKLSIDAEKNVIKTEDRLLPGSQVRFDEKQGNYIPFDRDAKNLPSGTWQKRVFDDSWNLVNVQLPGSIAEMDPVGRARRAGLPDGQFLMKANFKMEHHALFVPMLYHEMQYQIDRNRQREGMEPLGDKHLQNSINNSMGNTVNEKEKVQHEIIWKPGERKAAEQQNAKRSMKL